MRAFLIALLAVALMVCYLTKMGCYLADRETFKSSSDVVQVENELTADKVYATPISTYTPGFESSVTLHFAKGNCSGTIVGRHTILTAAHCVHDDVLEMVGDIPVVATVVANDGMDHVLVRTDVPIPGRIATFSPLPAPGSEVYIWGNPNNLGKMLRVGRIAGSHDRFIFIDLNGWGGDSGSAYFDRAGRIVAVNFGSWIVKSPHNPDEWRMSIAMPLAFQPNLLQGLP